MTTVFDEEQMMLLRRIPAVKLVSPSRIYYTNTFRNEFRRRVRAGESPNAIFEAAGLGPQIIGKKRIARCAERWLQDETEPDAGDECDVHGVGDGQPDPPRRPRGWQAASRRHVDACEAASSTVKAAVMPAPEDAAMSDEPGTPQKPDEPDGLSGVSEPSESSNVSEPDGVSEPSNADGRDTTVSVFYSEADDELEDAGAADPEDPSAFGAQRESNSAIGHATYAPYAATAAYGNATEYAYAYGAGGSSGNGDRAAGEDTDAAVTVLVERRRTFTPTPAPYASHSVCHRYSVEAVLLRCRARIDELEQRVAELERRLG